MPLQTETLSSYRTRVLRDLRDASQQYFNNQHSATPFADLDAWINEGLRWRDLWSGGSRSYRANVPLTQQIDQYDLRVLFPTDTVLDIATLWLLYGSFRVQLGEAAFSDVTNRWRPWQNYSNVPGAYCRYGATGVFIATAPAGPYTVDWDVVVLSPPVVNPGDADVLPYPYTEPVVPYACHLAKKYMRRWDEAEIFYAGAVRALRDIEGARLGQLPVPSVTARGTRA